jgi:hypothetical protein
MERIKKKFTNLIVSGLLSISMRILIDPEYKMYG